MQAKGLPATVSVPPFLEITKGLISFKRGFHLGVLFGHERGIWGVFRLETKGRVKRGKKTKEKHERSPREISPKTPRLFFIPFLI